MQYRVANPINKDLVKYKPGDIIDVSGEEADELLKIGAIESLNGNFNGNKLMIDLGLGGNNG